MQYYLHQKTNFSTKQNDSVVDNLYRCNTMYIAFNNPLKVNVNMHVYNNNNNNYVIYLLYWKFPIISVNLIILYYFYTLAIQSAYLYCFMLCIFMLCMYFKHNCIEKKTISIISSSCSPYKLELSSYADISLYRARKFVLKIFQLEYQLVVRGILYVQHIHVDPTVQMYTYNNNVAQDIFVTLDDAKMACNIIQINRQLQYFELSDVDNFSKCNI